MGGIAVSDRLLGPAGHRLVVLRLLQLVFFGELGADGGVVS